MYSSIDIRRPGQGFQELKLSRASGGDNAGVLPSMNCPADARRSLFRSDLRQSIFVIKYFYSQRFVFCSVRHFFLWFGPDRMFGIDLSSYLAIRQAEVLLRPSFRTSPLLCSKLGRNLVEAHGGDKLDFQPIRNHGQRAEPHTRRIENGVADGRS
jgi:hypothetical protein